MLRVSLYVAGIERWCSANSSTCDNSPVTAGTIGWGALAGVGLLCLAARVRQCARAASSPPSTMDSSCTATRTIWIAASFALHGINFDATKTPDC
jgi:hypothetical protein